MVPGSLEEEFKGNLNGRREGLEEEFNGSLKRVSRQRRARPEIAPGRSRREVQKASKGNLKGVRRV